MISILGTPVLFTASILLLLLSGLIVLTWGRKTPRYAITIVAAALLILLGVAAFSWSELVRESLQAQTLLRGWVMPREEIGSITVGVFQEPLGLGVTLLVAIVALLALFNRALLSRESRSERFYSALAISSAGVALCWGSMTPWLGFVGIAITIFGGFIALGTHWSTDSEAAAASRFGWEKSWGLILAWLGTCILAGSRAALVWEKGQSWEASGAPVGDAVGAALLVIGIFIQLQSFPFIGWVLKTSQSPPLFRVLLNQVFPAWAAFSILIRLEPQLRNIGVFPYFGWIALGSSVLTIASGLLESSGRRALGLWVSAGFSATLAALALAGPSSAVALLIGVGLGGAALAGAVSCLDVEAAPGSSSKSGWAKTGTFFGAACGTGLLGFVAAGGMVKWLGTSDQPGFIAILLFAYFVLCLLGWRLFWMATQIRNGLASWYSVILPFLFVLLGMGWLWTGTITGGALPGAPDRILPSLLDLFFGAASSPNEGSGIWIALTAQALAFIAAYSTAGREKDAWAGIRRALPGFSEFLMSGYGIDRAGQKVLLGLRWVGSTIERWVDRTFFDVWVWKKFVGGLEWMAARVAKADEEFSDRMNIEVERAVSIPGKLLQLLQNGDVQWYLLFALGSGAAILIRFLR